jgi:SAM-dependent methyltransferase
MSKNTNANNDKNSNLLWGNDDNATYYESIPIETLTKYATLGGFECGCDVDIIFDLIVSSKSILEIGAAYGRVLHSLLKRGYSGNLYGIERSKQFYDYLTKNYGSLVNIIHGDIKTFNPQIKFDTVMWMWGGIADFPQEDQSLILKKLSGWLEKDGKLIVDTISHTTTLAPEFTFEDQTYVERTENGIAYGYVPTSEEIAEYAKSFGFESEHLPYKTKTNRPRIMHILQEK